MRILVLLSFLAFSSAFGQSTLMVNKSTGAITGPVSAATFRSANSIGSPPVWGGITGTLSAQTDLQAGLDSKLDVTEVPASTNLIAGDGANGLSDTGIAASKVFSLTDPGYNTLIRVLTGGPPYYDQLKYDTDGTLAGNSDAAVASQKAVKTYVDAKAPATKKVYLQLLRPQRVDGTGTVYQNSDSTQNYFGQGKFSNSTDQATNFVEYRLIVPEDIDTSVDLRAKFEFRLSNTDTGKHRYVISMADVSDSASSGGTLINSVNLDFAGDASGASGDIETVGFTTLTSWKGSLTAGHHLVIRVARDGDDGTNDTSTVDSYSGPLEIEYQKQ